MVKGQKRILELLRKAIKNDARSLRQISIDSGLPYAVLYKIDGNSAAKHGISVETACKLAETLGLELVLKPKNAKKA